MKKSILVLITVLTNLLLSNPAQALELVCTTYPLKLITLALTRDIRGTTVTQLLNNGTNCAHEYNPTAADLKKIHSQHIILLANGLKLDDHIVERAVKINPALKVIWANKALEKSKCDPHTFASMDTAAVMAGNIAAQLIELDPENKSIYQKNLQNFSSELQKLVLRLNKLAAGQTIFVQYSVYKNLGNLLDCRILLLKEEKSAVTTPTELMRLVKAGKNAVPPAALIICDSVQDPTVRQLAKVSGTTVLEIDPLLHGPADADGDYFLGIMKNNAEKLEKALKK